MVTGMIGVRTESTPWYPNAYSITDAASGIDYALTSESVNLATTPASE